jgi:hypothetical protein
MKQWDQEEKEEKQGRQSLENMRSIISGRRRWISIRSRITKFCTKRNIIKK